ncbi:MAG: ATP synthase F0 subunit B [Chloroflexi bacterium]|nr:MAG: ATP synthase F0 subunit B [Chloroflexota bacterium]
MGEVLGQLGISGPLLLSQIVNFVILMVLLRLFLYQPVLGMLEKRKERIAQSLKDVERSSNAAAEAEKERAKILEEARREAQEVRAQSARDAERIAQEIRSRADQEATDIRMKGQADAEAQVQTILTDAKKQVADLAIAATEQLLGRELQNRSEQERFVNEYLAQQGGSGK